MSKRALIAGVTGQDGCYLAQLLLKHGYEVTGILDLSRSSSLLTLDYLGLLPKIQLRKILLSVLSDTQILVREVKPCEIYALAAQSSVSVFFSDSVTIMFANTNSVMNWPESIRLPDPGIRFFQASSSEMYGNIDPPCVMVVTLFNSLSLYAVSKVATHHLVRAH